VPPPRSVRSIGPAHASPRALRCGEPTDRPASTDRNARPASTDNPPWLLRRSAESRFRHNAASLIQACWRGQQLRGSDELATVRASLLVGRQESAATQIQVRQR
jgi:hypothetical protein